MKIARSITATLLVVLLGLMTGLGDRAHAMLENCNGGPCVYHLHTSVVEHNADHASVTLSEGSQHDPGSATNGGCNPFLCNVLALKMQNSATNPDQSDTVLAWQVTNLSALNEPDNPDRPPNA